MNSPTQSALIACLSVFLLLPSPAGARAQDEMPAEPEETPGGEEVIEMVPTEIGVRFTPAMAEAIGHQFTRQMKSRYGLDDKQADDVQRILSQRLMKLSHENATVSRDMVELMMATMIRNEGSFPKEEAMQFGKLAKEFIPALRGFFTDSARDLGKILTVKQRL